MIDIKDKHKCCGCSACAAVCPHGCIAMREDGEGFLYPEVNAGICVDCGLCEAVCPELNHAGGVVKPEPLAVLAAKNSDDELRMSSSSGGVFSLLAEEVLSRGGVVFGVRMNEDLSVHHSYIEDVAGLEAFRGSKYVQSAVGQTYVEVERFLKAGREVLFSGTPCQIAGLRAYLRKEYGNLLCVEVFCHGVPSHKVLLQYLSENFPDVAVSEVDYRNKRSGWKNYSVVVKGSMKDSASGKELKVNEKMPYMKNPFMRGFVGDIFLRPACYECPFKAFASGADLTLGDCWGAGNFIPEMDDDKGLSVVLIHSEKAEEYVNVLKDRALMETKTVDLEAVAQYNPSLMSAVKEPSEKRAAFFADDGRSFNEKIAYLCRESPGVRFRRWRYRVKRFLKKLYEQVLRLAALAQDDNLRVTAGHYTV